MTQPAENDAARRQAARTFLDSLPDVDGDIEDIVREANREGYERVMSPEGGLS